jgi:hypothetical protein
VTTIYRHSRFTLKCCLLVLKGIVSRDGVSTEAFGV